ncbi:hypothetical protein BU24DRAFT_437407 [Aaosphaeria arxii CBS 175.79]|uniref:Adhesin domain-containing protein n=1 Tax=Aaosphaeria arxii CBS 175.79 TaxID=1450172 RepID=A0A6A5X908_9PLEO|nr:uncharacterized protein BU24DRAFT_437407 [Aaosphaeria arxii CBS 175.79]KAF2009244.1 hypothetical protein BU24DRAFT_437407 [Aaosphaeria arxii CBS 175.79]
MYIDTEAANKGVRVEVTAHREPLRSATRYEEDSTPLLDSFVGQEAPPPSYLEATTPHGWHSRKSGDEEAGLLSFDGRQSMSRPRAEHVFRDGKRKTLREQCTRRRLAKVVSAIVVIAILAAILAAVTRGDEKQPKPVVPTPDPQPKPPKESYPIRWPQHCGKEYNARTDERDFGSIRSLDIQEAIHQLHGQYKRVSGWVHVVKAPDAQPAGTVQAKISYAASTSVDINEVRYEWSESGLSVGDPSSADSFDGLNPKFSACLGIAIVVYVAPGVEMENFNVNSVHLGMQIHSGVDFNVTNITSIKLASGTLDASNLKSRETHLETISGSISGRYDLRELLAINTQSGSVNINVRPQEAEQGNPKPALFKARSLSGSLRADFERNNIPQRDYQVEIDTEVGTVDGTFIHGSSTNITSVAGLITADIMPFGDGGMETTLHTSTTSGAQTVTLQAPYNKSATGISKLTSTHKSVSGALDLTYPQSWEGHVQGRSVSGIVHLQGRDLELQHEEQDVSLGSRVEAKKGKGDSEMTFKTLTGGCEVKVGKL